MINDWQAYTKASDRLQELLCHEIPNEEQDDEISNLLDEMTDYLERRDRILNPFLKPNGEDNGH